MRRRRLSQRARIEILERQSYRCACGCGADLRGQAVEYDHILARCLGGSEDLANFRGLLVACHAAKSARDVRMKAKADRCRRYMAEGKGRKRRGKPMQGRGFSKGWRRKVSGQVERIKG